VLPTEYVAEKECMFYSTNIAEIYRSTNNFGPDVQIRVTCRNTDLLWAEVYPI
jgi:hypothetical protein